MQRGQIVTPLAAYLNMAHYYITNIYLSDVDGFKRMIFEPLDVTRVLSALANRFLKMDGAELFVSLFVTVAEIILLDDSASLLVF